MYQRKKKRGMGNERETENLLSSKRCRHEGSLQATAWRSLVKDPEEKWGESVNVGENYERSVGRHVLGDREKENFVFCVGLCCSRALTDRQESWLSSIRRYLVVPVVGFTCE